MSDQKRPRRAPYSFGGRSHADPDSIKPTISRRGRPPKERHEKAYLDVPVGQGSERTRIGSAESIGQFTRIVRDHEDVLRMSWDDADLSEASGRGHGPVRFLSREEIAAEYGDVDGKLVVSVEKRFGSYVKCLMRECRRQKGKDAELDELCKKSYTYPERVADNLVEQFEQGLARCRAKEAV